MLDYSVLVLGAGVCFIGGLLGGLSGAGTGLIVAAFLTPIVGAKAVMPALAIIMLINNGSRVFYYRQSVDLKISVIMIALALPGTWFGTQLYMSLSVGTLEFILGAAILAVLAHRVVHRHRRSALTRATSSSASPESPAPSTLTQRWIGGPIALAYGFINSVVPGSGVMVLAFFSAIGMSASAVIANDAVLSAVLNLVKIALFRNLDGLPDSLILISLLCGLATIPGVWFAKWLSSRMQQKTQQGLIELVIAASALHLVIRALT
ncbi:MAG: TSUP family transporter [Betaproteobacteria bacterium]|nr:TSUP family transporter [Betaproteobacteria bacterium]